MTIAVGILIFLIRVFLWLLLLRIAMEVIQSFSRNFQPPRLLSIVFEPVFVVTDPPLRLVRRYVPPLRMGNVALDMSVLVVYFAAILIQILLSSLLAGTLS